MSLHIWTVQQHCKGIRRAYCVCVSIQSKVIDKKETEIRRYVPTWKVIRGHQRCFCSNNFWSKIDTDMGFVPMCLSRQCASTDMQHVLSEPTCDLDLRWPWPEMTSGQLRNWPIRFIKYMFRTDSTRASHWCQNNCSMFITSTLIYEKLFPQKSYFDLWGPLQPWILTWAQNRQWNRS